MYSYIKELVEAQDFFKSDVIKRGSAALKNSEKKQFLKKFPKVCGRCGTTEKVTILTNKLIRSLGGRNLQSNLFLLCSPCADYHSKMSSNVLELLQQEEFISYLLNEYERLDLGKTKKVKAITTTENKPSAVVPITSAFEKSLTLAERELFKEIKSKPYKYLVQLMAAQHNFKFPGIIHGVVSGPMKNKRYDIIAKTMKCEICGTRHNLTIDHRLPRCLGGGNNWSNLGVLCKVHNTEKGKMEGVLLKYLCTEEGRQKMKNDHKVMCQKLNSTGKMSKKRNSDYICNLLKQRGIYD